MNNGRFISSNNNVVSMSATSISSEQQSLLSCNSLNGFNSNSKISVSTSSTNFNKVISYVNREKGKIFKRV